MLKTFPQYHQLDQMDCGPTCLRMIAKYFGKHYTSQTLREKSQISRDGVSMLSLAEAAESIGLRSIGVKVTMDKLINEVPLPCVLHWGQNHFVVLYQIDRSLSVVSQQFLSDLWGGRRPEGKESLNKKSDRFKLEDSNKKEVINNTHLFRIADPARGHIAYTADEFQTNWLAENGQNESEGIALLIEPTPQFYNAEGEDNDIIRLGQLLGFLWTYKKLIIQLVLGMLAGSTLSILLPFLTQSIVDVGIGTQNISFINLILIAQLMLLCCTASLDFLRSWILLHISTRLNLTILSEFLSKLLRLPVSFFDNKQFGDIMQRIGDHHRIESFLTGQTLNILFSFFNLLVFSFLLSYYHLLIFQVAVGASILYTIWVILFLRRRRKIDNYRFDISSGNQSQIVQLIQGIHDIKLAGAEISKRWEWEQTQAKLFRWNVKSLSLSQIQQAGALLINQSKNIFITYLAARAVIDGQLSLGGLISIQYILSQFNAPVEQFVIFLQSWQDAQLSLERLNEIQGLPDEEPANESKRRVWDHRQDIKITDLTYSFPGADNRPVLRNVNLTIEYGKTTAIVGTSGSGKTTLLKLLLRFYDPQSGSISLSSRKPEESNSMLISKSLTNRVNELSLNNISHKSWRQQCGVVMQEGFIFSDSIARNIAVDASVIDRQRLYDAAATANIHEFIESLPLGYYTKIGAEGNGISQGQKQRILIARSVYKDPQLLLFDEATNALDANNEGVIIRNLAKFFKGRTVVIVAHRLSTVKNADKIVVMEKGEIVEIGTHTELLLARGKYFELISNQLELSEG